VLNDCNVRTKYLLAEKNNKSLIALENQTSLHFQVYRTLYIFSLKGLSEASEVFVLFCGESEGIAMVKPSRRFSMSGATKVGIGVITCSNEGSKEGVEVVCVLLGNKKY
jgi:hypothetical protein